MLIDCKKFGCQKAVQVCYWSCKFRKNCKDWQGALDEIPGKEAMRSHLEAASQKSGRLFDAETMTFQKTKTRRAQLPIAAAPARADRLAPPGELAAAQTRPFKRPRTTGRAAARKA